MHQSTGISQVNFFSLFDEGGGGHPSDVFTIAESNRIHITRTGGLPIFYHPHLGKQQLYHFFKACSLFWGMPTPEIGQNNGSDGGGGPTIT